MDELTPLVSKSCTPLLGAETERFRNESKNDGISSSIVNDINHNESDCHESSAVVGVNPVSSQQARMEELKLLKSRGLARKESVKMSPSERLSDINGNVSHKYLKETRKNNHLESMEYLHNPLSSQQAKVEHQARMEELKSLKLDGVSKMKSLGLTPGTNLPDADSSPNAAEERRRTTHLLESMEYLQNPLSSQQAKLEHQARMEEVKLLRLNGITKEKSLNLAPSEGITDIDSFHSSLKSLKEERKKQHLESMEYLHRYQNNEVSSKKSPQRQNDCPPVISPSPSEDGCTEPRDSPEPTDDDNRDGMSLQQCEGVVERENAVESPSVVSHTSDELKENKHQNDLDHTDCTEILEKSNFNNTKEEYHNDIIVTDQDSMSKICTDDSEGDAKCDEISVEEDNMIMKDDSQSDIDDEMNAEEYSVNEDNLQDNTQVNDLAKEGEECVAISSSQKRNAPMSVESHTSRITENARPKRPTRRTRPRFENYVYSFSSDRDSSVGSHDSNRVSRECGNRRVSDLSSQSSLDSGFHGQPRRKPVTPENPRTTSNTAFSSGRSSAGKPGPGKPGAGRPSSGRPGSGRPRSVPSHSSMISKSTKVPEKSAPVPLYDPLVKKGIKKNTKRDSNGPTCMQKWDPKAHSDLSGCERCLSFATEKELSAYHINGHHHRIMMTRGGCNKCCKLFPRECSLPAPRLCQRCFHDTHTKKLW